jgi:hypothetical protein
MAAIHKLIVAMFVTVVFPSVGQPVFDLSGRVIESESHAGIPNVEVKLIPPRSISQPIRFANTNNDGAFVFRQVSHGRYLIEVSQGYNLLNRSTVDTASQPQVEIQLKRMR